MDSLPSPADSTVTTPIETSPGPGIQRRKRARSRGSSDASSSKRAISEDPSLAPDPTPSSSHLSPMSDTTQPANATTTNDDVHMASQEPAGEQTSSAAAPTETRDTAMAIPAPERLELVVNMKKQPMNIGDEWYVVSRRWYRKWEKALTGEIDKEGGVLESQLGPVDNSDIVDKNGDLLPSVLTEGIDVEYLPAPAWILLIEWYGQPQHSLPRRVIGQGILKQPFLELWPRVHRLLRVVKQSVTESTEPLKFTLPTTATFGDVHNAVLSIVGRIPEGEEMRIWTLNGTVPDGAEYPAEKVQYAASDCVLPRRERDTESRDFADILLDLGAGVDDPLAVEITEQGKWLVHWDSYSVVGPPGPLFNSGTDFFSRMNTTVSKTVNGSSKAIASSSTLKPSPNIAGSSSSALIRSKKDQKLACAGTIGLGNMGNTCFMNSALQCLAHTEELTKYFLTGVYREELNPDNPLGMGGAIAEAFGALLQRIWQPASSTSYSPRDFKNQLQRFAPQFSGYQQHDSQELVAFLLDGLHEDLNRIKKKPYVEKPDWEGGGELELLQLARSSWEGYLQRNDSVIVDLFQGQYKSTLVCPECQKVSITFDPFMYLTLPLPIQKKWNHNILYIPWDNDKPHVKIPVELDRNASFREVRRLLGRWMDVNPDNLLTLETFSHRFYKNLDDTVMVADMMDADHIVCFELPFHAQQSSTWRPDEDPSKNPLVLPVQMHKESYGQKAYGGSHHNSFAHPLVLALMPEQAKDMQSIYNAIVDRLQRWTMHARDLFQWESEVSVPVDGADDMLVMTEITETGDVVTVDVGIPEGDITDEKGASIHDMDVEPVLNNRGPKPDLFTLSIQIGHENYGTQSAYHAGAKWVSWETRQAEAQNHSGLLLRPGDGLFCEWEENLRNYYFGDDRTAENALWHSQHWGEYVHPEYEASKAAAAAKQDKGMNIYDCLDEFTKEERLGEDDLWYCPNCKKHQQATKKFDLWSVPDILVVHLKRFSNSRILRDKIDAFVDFPTEDLDLTHLVGEREVAHRLEEQGHDLSSLGLHDTDEPLKYDLYAVDEHIGGLGGGHYRAFAQHHENGKWYHFDDSYVTPAQAHEAVNANAYLLFYRRRTTSRPIGGKTHDIIQAMSMKPPGLEAAEPPEIQLPTPPEESDVILKPDSMRSLMDSISQNPGLRKFSSDGWPTPKTNGSSSTSSPPPLDDAADPPSFEQSGLDELLETSSMQAEPDNDTIDDFLDSDAEPSWQHTYSSFSDHTEDPYKDGDDSSNQNLSSKPHRAWSRHTNGVPDPSSDDPFSDQARVSDDGAQAPVKEIPLGQSTLLDIDV